MSAGQAGTTGSAGAARHDRQRQRGHHGRRRHGRHLPDGAASSTTRRSRPSTWWSTGRAACSTASARAELVCPNKADTSWSKLKTAIETVITQLDAQVRFGFTTIFGTNPRPGGGSCPLITGTLADNVPPALNNAAAIKTKYDSSRLADRERIARRTGKKFESPAMYAITGGHQGAHGRHDARATSTSSSSPTGRRTTATTRSRSARPTPPSARCRPRSPRTSRRSSSAFRRRSSICPAPSWTLSRTPARESRPCRAVPSGLDATAIFDQCQGVTPWRTDLTASGHPTTRGPTATVGTYATTAGPTKPFKPNASDQTMLVTQLSTALAGVKSCTFDLNDVSGKAIKVDTTKLNSGAREDRRDRGSARARPTAGTSTPARRRSSSSAARRAPPGAIRPARRSISSSPAAPSSSSNPMTKTRSFACPGRDSSPLCLAWLHRRREADD